MLTALGRIRITTEEAEDQRDCGAQGVAGGFGITVPAI
jgi:hypothetical protein